MIKLEFFKDSNLFRMCGIAVLFVLFKKNHDIMYMVYKIDI